MKRKVFVVPHSHWDREWYFSQEDSNVILSQNMSFLLDYLTAHEEFPTYVFDGQYSVMHDFLEKFPEKKPLVEKLISADRLKIGPWYTQCDTLLSQTESVIRNLLLGKTGADELGGSMRIGYLPDIFGQNAYLPSIFKRFGLKYSVLQRGLYNAQVADNLTFDWQSPNGESVRANNIFFGYGPGKFLASDSEYIEKSLLPILDRLSEMTAESQPLLLPAGGDQVLIRTHFPKVVAELNALDLPYEFKLSSYEAFMEAVKPDKVIRGELIASQKSRIHATIRSQRVDLKMLTAKVEEKIYQQLEPLAVLAEALGADYPQSWINACLRDLFDAEAHDSLGGCNSDETNLAIQQRLLKIERIVDGQINILKKQIARGVNADLIAFNLLPKTVTKNLKFVIFSREKEVAIKSLQQTLLSQEYISGGKQVKVTAEGEREFELPGYYRSEILATVEFDGFGYRTFELENLPAQSLTEIQQTKISNDFYTIKFDTGKICLIRKSDGAVKDKFFDFENSDDAGDSYDYSPGDSVNFSGDFKLLEVKGSDLICQMRLSCQLNHQEILTTLTLEKQSDLIKIRHEINNQQKDHRVRVRFFDQNSEGVSYGDQGYSVQKRQNVNPHLASWREEGFVESPQAIYPLERFVHAGEISLYTKGLKEYEACADSLNLTLFRSVGLLGKDDLAWRPGRASGINNKIVETPNAQMLEELTFSYAYKWSKEFEAVADYRSAEKFSASQLTYQFQNLNSFEERLERFELPQPDKMKDLPVELELLSLPQDIFVASFKKAEQSEESILRIFNPSDEEVKLDGAYTQTNLAEKPLDKKIECLKAKDFATIQIWNIGGQSF